MVSKKEIIKQITKASNKRLNKDDLRSMNTTLLQDILIDLQNIKGFKI
jgi:hypothetical protein